MARAGGTKNLNFLGLNNMFDHLPKKYLKCLIKCFITSDLFVIKKPKFADVCFLSYHMLIVSKAWLVTVSIWIIKTNYTLRWVNTDN